MSADPFDDQRAEPVRYDQRQPLPGRDEDSKLGIERVQIGYRATRRQAELIDERRRPEPPVAFERIRPGADFAASKVEYPTPPLARSAHDFPIHKIVGCKPPRRAAPAAIKRQNLVPEIEVEHRCNHSAIA